jgi:iron uptake system EfeUOB component EfeO/EfeM
VLLTRTAASFVSQVELDLSKDMYQKQFEAFLHAVRTGDNCGIRCLFDDAARTYETSWWIAEAAGSPIPDGSVPK